MTKIIYILLINLVTPKARAKHEPFVQQTSLRTAAETALSLHTLLLANEKTNRIDPFGFSIGEEVRLV